MQRRVFLISKGVFLGAPFRILTATRQAPALCAGRTVANGLTVHTGVKTVYAIGTVHVGYGSPRSSTQVGLFTETFTVASTVDIVTTSPRLKVFIDLEIQISLDHLDGALVKPQTIRNEHLK
jgi:hypothetical protein